MKTLSDILADIPHLSPEIEIIVIDLFCGAGGYSWGVEKAQVNGMKAAQVLLCCNHDALAIESHYANMPHALHLIEDIRAVSMDPFRLITEAVRRHHPHMKILLHASLECTNHSKAKGGMSRDADSRTLADHLFRYIETIRPDYISIENVEEFMIWGPLQIKVVKDKKTGEELYSPLEVKRDKKKKTVEFLPVWIPVPERKAEYYNRWVRQVKAHGYKFEHRLLNSADFGAYTARKRFFGLFALPHLPISWPEPTHAKSPQPNIFGQKAKWKPVRDVLALHIQGKSIFTKNPRPVDATLERITAGVIKFVAGGKKEFMVKYNSMNQRGKYVAPGVDDPCPVVSTQGRLGVAQVAFMQRYNSGSPMDKNTSLDQPCGVVTTCNRFSYVQAQFLSAYYGNGHNHSINSPSPTVTTKDRLAYVVPQFLSKQFSGHPDSKNCSIDDPAGSVTCIDHHALISPFIAKYYSGNPNNMVSSIDVPAPTIRTKDGAAIVSPQFLSSYHYNDQPKCINSPCQTLTCKDKVSLVTPEFIQQRNGGSPDSKVYSIDNPARTVTTTGGNQELVQPIFIDNQYGNGFPTSVDLPAGPIMTNPKQNIVTCEPWVMGTHFGNVGSSTNEPAKTITADRHWHYLMNPQYSSAGGSVDAPCFTLIARMDKMPPYLMKAETTGEMAPFIKLIDGVLIYEIYPDDSPAMVKLKEVMAMYGLVNIKMQMLLIEELKRIMGLPTSYVLKGSQTNQKKFIGNAVETTQAKTNIEALASALHENRINKIAV